MDKAIFKIAISDSIYKKYSKILKKENLLIVKNGIDEKMYLHETHEILNKDIINIVIVGGICKSKGQDQAIKACEILKHRGIFNFTLSVIGKSVGNYEEELKQYVNVHKMEQHIKFCGGTDDTASVYKNCDIVLVCSKAEAFGRVTVEAMLSGALVIGADSAGTKELIGKEENGLLYKMGDVTSLANKIEYAIQNKKQSVQIAKNGQRHMKTNMTAEINAKNINDVYLRIRSKQNEF